MTHTPRPGDFGVQPGTSPAMWLTRLGTFSRYGHACVVVDVDPLTVSDGLVPVIVLVEAHPRGARRRVAIPNDEFLWSRCPLTDAQRVAIVAAAERSVGIRYDWRAIFGFFVRFWGAHWRGQSADHADAKMICSELVAWAYRVAGHDVAPVPTVAPGDVSPGDLAQHMLREAEDAP